MRVPGVASPRASSSFSCAVGVATLLVAVAVLAGPVLSTTGAPHAPSASGCAAAFPGSASCATGLHSGAFASGSATWINVSASSQAAPPLDYWASLALDFADRYLVLFGGCSNVRCPEPAQTWTFAHGSWTNRTNGSVQPPARSYAPLDYDSADGYAVLFGGVGGSNVFGDTWTFSAGRWTNLTASLGTSPSARWGASFAYDPINRGLLLFGGMSASGAFLNDTWIFASGAWRKLNPPVAPPARFEASMAWDAATSQAVLVDGCGTSVCPLGDAWRFENGTWSPLPSGGGGLPPARNLATLSYDAASSALVLFGGIRNFTSLGDLWVYASGGWTLSTASAAPTPREGAAAIESTQAWTPQGTAVAWPYLALWGGDRVPCPTCRLEGLADTWVYEPGLNATLEPPSSPAAVGSAAAFRTAASGGTAPYRFTWTYGDGASEASGANATHSFAAPGSYSVSVVVVDDAGATARATALVTVTDASLGVYAWAAVAAFVIAVGVVSAWILRKRRPPAT